ncbi:MAG: hypothetical protein HXY40_08680 [Chloroflexi bacterium]|nr:hypothetical protein [Chloroflexota bacterium]
MIYALLTLLARHKARENAGRQRDHHDHSRWKSAHIVGMSVAPADVSLEELRAEEEARKAESARPPLPPR